MKKIFLVGGIILVLVAGVVYFTGGSSDKSDVAMESPSKTGLTNQSVALPKPSQLRPPAEGAVTSKAGAPMPTDPRLMALRVSPDNGFIQFVVGADGNVIKEIDTNPQSLGFKKPMREYVYSGDRVIGLTSYQYLADNIQVTQTNVSYKPDGSVDQYRESTSYVNWAKKDKR